MVSVLYTVRCPVTSFVQFLELRWHAYKVRVLSRGCKCDIGLRIHRHLSNGLQALRLVLNTISTFAIRYGRYIEPLLSLSIDFYIRIFVRIHAAPIEVKKHPGNTLALLTPPICSTDTADESKTSIYYVCSGCTSFHEQELGRVVERTNKKSGAVNLQYKTATGPPVNSACPECGYSMHVGVVCVV